VDDWAWNKGKSFGTILVDLERGVVVDLLPTRSADSLTAWLEQHPEVMVVSRDRQGSYADGARRGAPQAMQVADRFHLTLNLTQAVERELAVQRQYLQLAPSKALELQAPRQLNRARSADRQIPIQSSVRQQEVEMRRQRRQENMELFQTLHRMKAAGLKVTEMAKELGLNRRRLDRWCALTPCRNVIGCSRGRVCRKPFASTCESDGKPVAIMVELFSRKCANSVTSVASPDWPHSYPLGVNRRRRPQRYCRKLP
jgi:transposase